MLDGYGSTSCAWARPRPSKLTPKAASPGASTTAASRLCWRVSTPAPDSGRDPLARHLALAVELRALIQNQLRSADRALQPRRRQQFDPFSRGDLAVDRAC